MPQISDPIPCQVQLYDGDDEKFPVAIVTGPDDQEIGEVDLELVETGLYKNFSLFMPNYPSVIAQYLVYDDEEHTTLSEKYQITSEVFELIPASGSSSGASTTAMIGILDSQGCPANNCEPTAIEDTVVKGSDRVLTARLVRSDNGEPFDISGFTQIEFKFLNADDTVLSVKYDDDSTPIVVLSNGAGKMTCALTSTQTDALLAGTPAPFEVVVTIGTDKNICQMGTQLAIVERYF